MNNSARHTASVDELETLLAEGRQVCVLLGAVDTGKTTLAFELARRLAARGRRVALVDSDVGQSHVGPPTTIGWAFISDSLPPEQSPQPESLYFVGSTSPARRILPVVVGTKKMVDAASDAGADVILVDTSGMVRGDLAWTLKYFKLDIISPTHIAAVQREAEIEHLLRPWEGRQGVTVLRLRTDPNVRIKSTKERTEYRQALFREYFAEACEVEFLLDEVRIVDADGPGRGAQAQSPKRPPDYLDVRARYSADNIHPVGRRRISGYPLVPPSRWWKKVARLAERSGCLRAPHTKRARALTARALTTHSIHSTPDPTRQPVTSLSSAYFSRLLNKTFGDGKSSPIARKCLAPDYPFRQLPQTCPATRAS